MRQFEINKGDIFLISQALFFGIKLATVVKEIMSGRINNK